ncbi:PREDICTED: E3 ubiquitin-protein ligase listerin [Nicrophorus vespilloides]|uniref:E3 ubiquitin-protein ligase listerin n=1 Tax=Nicrophorus vespilloides TaxID=110193 RepID=A0ABM1M8E4_NICVS|nr:PREDICTED: E3 ubiquitin-protein ligase listerin [Nicrophorus vespilloides]
MGGKQKQAQRTKNNARPSNSGRSAELLASTIPPFGTFSGLKETCFANAGFSLVPIDDIDSSVDSNFQLVLKKMSKKDGTTKLKALQEFTELIKNTDAETIKAVLPFWPRLYNNLSTDAEHRVREAAQLAQHQVVLKAKRNIAPYLKQLAGPWFTSQYDTYPPAASAATQSFSDAFPANKLQEAIIFCQEEILNYICDNLIIHTAQTLSNPKTNSLEDSKARYERVIISSLQGYALYLSKVPKKSIETVMELHQKIIMSAKFWKFGRNDVSSIRASWYMVLTAMFQMAPFLLENKAAQVTKAVFSNMDESDPAVLPNVWEAALLTITTIENWWKYINVDELFLPKLWKVLRQGGQGNATVIYPNLLPLLSHLPPNLDIESFYNNYFNNMRIGIQQKTIRSSQSESRALCVALIECLQYTILKNQSNLALCETLIDEQLLVAVEWSLENGQAAYKTLFNQISSLIQYWHRNVEPYPNYKTMCDRVWIKLKTLFENKIGLNEDYMARQIEFFLCLKSTTKPKKQLKVKFDGNDSKSGDDGQSQGETSTVSDEYLNCLNYLICSTCICCVNTIRRNAQPSIVDHLLYMVQEFENETLLKYLNSKVNSSENMIEVCTKIILPWIDDDSIRSRGVIDLLFIIFKYLKYEEKALVLKTLDKVPYEDCFGWCVAKCLSHPFNMDLEVQNWLGSKRVGDFLVRIMQYEIADESSPEFSLLLKQALTETFNGDLLIRKKSVFEIIESLSACLMSPHNHPMTIDTCASLGAYLAAIVYTESLKLAYSDKLLIALFTLSCCSDVDPETLSKDTIWEVNTAWQDIITLITGEIQQNELKILAETFAKIVEKKLFNAIETINSDEVVEKIVSFLNSVAKCKPLYVGELISLFMERTFIPLQAKILKLQIQLIEYLKGNLSDPYEPTNSKVDRDQFELIDEEKIAKYFTWKQIMLSVISSPIDEDDYCESDDGNTGNILLKLAENTENMISGLLYDIALLESVNQNLKSVRHYDKLDGQLANIKDKLVNILDHIDSVTKDKIGGILVHKAGEEGWLWANTVQLWFVELSKVPATKVYDKLLPSMNTKLGKLHLTQILGSNLSYDNVHCKVGPVGSVVILRSLLHCDEIDVQIAEVFNKIQKLRDEDMGRYFYNINFTNWSQVQTAIEIMRMFTVLVDTRNNKQLNSRQWDFILVSLANWSGKLNEIKSTCDNIQIAAFILSIVKLFATITQYIEELAKEQPANSLVDEWKNVFVIPITTDIMKIWLYLSEKYECKVNKISITDLVFLHELGNVIGHVNANHIFQTHIAGMPKWSKVLKQCCTLLINSEHSLQLWGYNMLITLSSGLIEVDSKSVDTNTPHEKGMIFEQFKDLLVRTHNIVSIMLHDFKLGEDSCRVEPYTDSYTYTFGYLLIWDVLLNLCEKSSRELRFQYADWLRKEELLNSLLSSIFKLMPTDVLRYTEGKTKPFFECFVEKPKLLLGEEINSDKLERFVCWIYASTLAQLPASVRQWWTNAEARTSQIVERVTTAYVSPSLCSQELTDVSEHETTFKNMVVKVHPYAREVIAVYTVDDSQMELVMALPTNYPLCGPDVQCNRQIGGISHKPWLMQLKMCVLHQNGRIWDALSLWNNNLDKKFDGVEECYICFAVLHPGTYQLPKLSCKTCRKKFHAACLYKWFSTSNKSTCPICRNLF